MEIHQIKYVLAVVREGNFSRAAEACNVSQPSITRAIRKLEGELGGLLFNRRPGAIELTQLGRSILPRLESVYDGLLATLSEAAELSSQKKQRLRIGLMCTLGPERLIAIIDQMAKRLPDVELTLEEGKAHAVVERLIADHFDVAIACLPRFPEEIAPTPLYAEKYAVALPQGHRFEAMVEVPFSELIGEHYLERLNCEFDDYYAAHFGDQPFSLRTRFSSEREDWVQALIQTGYGIAIVPEFLPVAQGVVTRPLTDPQMIRVVSLLTVRGRPYGSAVDSFVRAASTLKWRLSRAE